MCRNVLSPSKRVQMWKCLMVSVTDNYFAGIYIKLRGAGMGMGKQLQF